MCRLTILLATAAALIGCHSNDVTDRSGATIRDSAGIVIVHNESPALEPLRAWSLAAAPDLVIGSEADSMQQLHRVRGAVRLGNGQLAIANSGTFQIRVYSPTGEFVRTFGREGSGPGEFSFLDGIWPLPGDSILAWDGDRQLMHAFDGWGQYARTVTFKGTLADRPKRFPDFDFVGLTFVHDTLPRTLNETWWEWFSFVWLSPDADSLGAIGPLRGMEYMATEWQGSQLRAQRSLGRAAAFAVGPEAFYHGDSDGYRVLVFQPDGRLIRIVERKAEPQPITAEVQAAYIRERLGAATNPQLRAEWERYFTKIEFPESAPSYRRFEVDSEGNLWIENWSIPGSTEVVWSVFSADGRWMTDVHGPLGQPLEIGRDYMILLLRDDIGTERVGVFRITKPASTNG